MNKRFFEGMGVFSTVLLVVGLIGSVIMLFTMTTVQVPVEIRNSISYETQFSPLGFGASVAGILGSVALFCILKGISLIGQRLFENESDAVNNTSSNQKNTVEQDDSHSKSTNWVVKPQLIVGGVIVLAAIILVLVLSLNQ